MAGPPGWRRRCIERDPLHGSLPLIGCDDALARREIRGMDAALSHGGYRVG